MRAPSALLTSLFLLGLSACSKTIELHLPSTASVTIYDMSTGKQRIIEPKTELHQKLSRWTNNNQEGWQPYLATPPAQGIIVRAEGLDVQFIGEHAIVHSPKGVFTKKVNSDELAFLPK